MSSNLMLKLQLQLAEKVSGPLKKMQAASLGNAKALEATRAKLLELEKQNGLIQKIRNQEGAWKREANQLRANRALLDNLRNSGTATQTQIAKQTRAVERGTLSLDKQGSKLSELRAKAANSGITNLTQDQARLSTQIAATTQQLQQQNAAMEKMDGLRANRDAMLGTAAKIGGTGLGMKMMGERGLQKAADFVMPGFAFDKTMARVQALTQLDKNSEAFQAMRQQARDLGAATNFDATDAAMGQAYLAQAGFSPEAIMAAMPGMLDMSLASGVDLGQTSNIAANISRGFGIDPTEMGRVADVLTAAFTNSNTTLQSLGDTMSYMAPYAKELGVSMEESAAMAGLLGNIGIQGSKAGTAMRGMFARMAKLPASARNAISELSIELADAQGNMRQLPDILIDIAKATSGMGNLERMKYITEIFGTEASSAVSELINQANSGEMQAFTEKMNNAEGTAKRVAAIMNEHLGGKLQELESGWQEFGNLFYDSISEGLSTAVVWVTDLVGVLNNWAKENPALVKTIAYTVGIVLALMTGVGSLLMVVGAALAPLALFKFGIGALGIKFAGFIPILKTAGNAFIRFGVTLLTTPIGWFILAVAALAGAAYMIYKNWDFISAYFSNLWLSVKATFTEWKDGAAAWASELWQSIGNFFNSGIGNITASIINWSPLGLFYNAFAELMSWFGVELPASFTEAGGNLLTGLVKGITDKLGWVKDQIFNVGSNVINWFKEKLDINSPSKVFMKAGASISKGAALGIENTLPRVAQATNSLAATTLAPIPAQSNRQSASAPVVHMGGDTIHISIDAVGMDAQSIAAAVSAELDKRERQKRARTRSSFA